MTSSSLAALRVGCAALFAAAMCQCGLSAAGDGAPVSEDGAPGSASGGGYGPGGSSSGSASDDGPGGSSGGSDDAAQQTPGDDATTGTGLPPKDASVADARKGDAAAKDAALEAGSVCAKLDTCCPILTAVGVAASTVTSCYSAATSGNESTCATVLGAFQSLGICF